VAGPGRRAGPAFGEGGGTPGHWGGGGRGPGGGPGGSSGSAPFLGAAQKPPPPMPAPASTAEKQAGQWLRPDMPLLVSILGVRPNSPTTTTSVLFSRPRSSRSSSRADSASSSRGSAQPSP